MAHHRLIILGAGTAGLSAWKQAGDVTDEIVMIDPGPLGTTCARVGCMPSKALLQIAKEIHQARRLHEHGLLTGQAAEVDGAAVMTRVRELRDRFTAGPLKAVERMGERYIKGRARFTGPDCIEVNGETHSADGIVAAIGTKPLVPGNWPDLGEKLQTSDSIFEMADLPRRVGVIGAGAIGCELGQALAMLGCEVHLFGRDHRLAGTTSEAVNEVIGQALSDSLHLHLGENAEPVALETGVAIQVGDQRIEVDAVVAAIGRRPVIDDLGLEALGMALDENGLPEIDPDSLRAGNAPVWFAGDINGIRPLMHEAADEGRLAAWHALHPDAECLGRRTPMAIVFTEPQVAWAGRRSADLPDGAITGQSDFSRQGRAIIKGYQHGLMQVHAEENGQLIGAEMACAGAEHLAHELAWLIQQRMHVIEALQLPFYHPVLEEGLRTALHDIRRQLPERERRPDLPLCDDAPESLPGT